MGSGQEGEGIEQDGGDMIEFTTDPNVRFWSQFVFYFAVINTVATMLFTVVVVVGGVFDVKFLLHTLKTEAADETDNGMVKDAKIEKTKR